MRNVSVSPSGRGLKMQQNGGISNYSPKKTAKMFGLHHISDDLLCDSDKKQVLLQQKSMKYPGFNV